MNENIFDLSDLTDVPADVLKEIMTAKSTGLLMSLFNYKERLTIDEIVVGLIRKYNIKIKRIWVTSTMYNLQKRGFIKKN